MALRGKRLSVVLAIIGAMCFALQGYDQNVLNGLLTLDDWVGTFPQINTSDPKYPNSSVIQGRSSFVTGLECVPLGSFKRSYPTL